MDYNSSRTLLLPTHDHIRVLKLFAVFAALATILTFAWHLHLDFLAFLALGPGGTPSTTAGFMRVKLLSLLALKNPYLPRTMLPGDCAEYGYLADLLERKGERPITRGIAPHRQITQKASETSYEILSSTIVALGSSSGSLVAGISCFERHGIALFNGLQTKRNEICHLHASDGSMHVVLGNADSKTVLESGWAERHPLSRGGWFERFVPAGFVLVYAPRDEADMKIVLRIVEAGT